MPLTTEEAAAALKDITQTEQRSTAAYSYRMSSPHLILWGFVWLIGYGVMAAKIHWDPLWLVLSIGGSVGSFYIGWRMSNRKQAGFDWRYTASFLVICGFISAILTVLPPQSDAQFGAFFPILVALYYALIGIWTRGLRMLFAGVALAVLTLIGFFYLRDVFDLWMAIVGGGGLILGGLWLRSV
ncbi:MAG TPA: hypothetical protein VIJ85_11985 [Rhizomicrobium sp.]